jgi:hypothetical protein
MFGQDFLLKIGLNTPCFSMKITNWMDFKIPMKATHFWDDPTSMYQSLLSPTDDEEEIEETIKCNCINNLMDAKYEIVNPTNVGKSQTHLSSS